ncbi:MAG: DUF3857 domain-containing protein [Thermoflexibacteraceae bacterium]
MKKNYTVTHFLYFSFFLLLSYFNISKTLALPLSKIRGGDVATLNFEYREYNWLAHRLPMSISPQEQTLPAIILKDKRSYEYVYDNQKKLRLLATIHKIIKINTLEALENFNKVYLPANELEQVWVLKTRCINPNGKIIELPSEAIRDVDSWEQNGKEKIFAIEGAEVGCEIEYFYTVEKSLKYFGMEIFQSPFLTKNVDFELISPQKLVFKAQIYNHSLNALQQTYKYKQKNTLYLHLDTLNALKQEPYAQYDANLMRIDYKLSYSENSQQKLLTWDDAATFFFQKIYTHRNQLKSIAFQQKTTIFLQNLLKNASNDREKILRIEEYVKANFQHIRSIHHQKLEDIWQNKYACTEDLVKLLAYLFDQAHIQHQLVLTAEQQQFDLETNFENWLYLEKYLFYFPTIQEYIAPLDVAYRLGTLPYSYHQKKGLFMDTQLFGGMLHTQLKNISAVFPTAENVKLYLDLQTDQSAYNLYFEQTFNGHYALLLGQHQTNSSTAQQQQLVEYLTSPFLNHLSHYELVREKSSSITICGRADNNRKLIGMAGKHWVLQVGKLLRDNYKDLGLLQDRKQPLLFDFPKKNTYQLQFELPQGYIVRNLEAVNTHSSYRNAKGEGLSFQAHYELEGNLVTITISEELNLLFLAPEEYVAFYKVVEEMQKFKEIKLIINKL